MKKTAIAAAGLLIAVGMVADHQGKGTEISGELFVNEVFAADTAEEIDTQKEETKEIPDLLTIDPKIPIHPGSRIAVVSKSTSGEFWDEIRKGMEAAVEEVNEVYGFRKDDQIEMTFEGPDDEQNVEEQINLIDAVLAENPDLLCLAVGDMESCQAQLEAARENGIPVIVFDSNVNETQLVRAFRATDNTKVGEMAAEELVQAIGEEGKVAVFSPQEKTQSSKERAEGFVYAVSRYPDVEVVEIIYMDQVEDMKTAMQETLDKYLDLNGVACLNEDVAEMYLELEKDEERVIAMVGVDATPRQIEAIEKGEQIGVVSQNPYEMGYQTILAALNTTAPDGESQPMKKNVRLEPVWLELKTLDNPIYSEYIYE